MFTLTLVTPERKMVTSEEVTEVFVPASRGELNILPGHAPLMTMLSTGVLRYRLAQGSEFRTVAISWGYCQVNAQGINVLAETAEWSSEIDASRARQAQASAEKALMADDLDPAKFEKYANKLARSTARLTAAANAGEAGGTPGSQARFADR
jgi:F-type H+-transporting ATPase subunit epsilon